MFGISINKIVGQSMQPRLAESCYGCFLSNPWQQFRIGDICKVEHPKYGLIVKSLAFIDSNGLFWFKGINTRKSVSTIEIGPVRRDQISGKLLFDVAPPAIKPEIHNKPPVN